MRCVGCRRPGVPRRLRNHSPDPPLDRGKPCDQFARASLSVAPTIVGVPFFARPQSWGERATFFGASRAALCPSGEGFVIPGVDGLNRREFTRRLVCDSHRLPQRRSADMSKALSPDLRLRVLEAVAEDQSHCTAAARLGASAAGFSRWRRRARVEGGHQNPGLWKRERPGSCFVV